MPIYEYACTNCDHSLDALQKVSDDPLRECPQCGEAALKRLISAPRFRLKGEGWYETDFKNENQRNVLKSDGEASTSEKTDGKSVKKEEQQTEKKKETRATTNVDSD